jgi:hypothetical protein
MHTTGTSLFTALLTACMPGILAAQVLPSAVPSPTLPRNDIQVAFVVHNASLPDTDDRALGRVYWYEETAATVRLNIGHYWTTHLKTEFSVTPPIGMNGIEQELLPNNYPVHTQREGQMVRMAFAGLYQFGENAFTHPFVEAGGTLDTVRVHRYRMAENRTAGFPPFPLVITAIDERYTQFAGGVFVGFGAKCYFNRRVFVRPEFLLNWTPNTEAQPAVSFGFGVDF